MTKKQKEAEFNPFLKKNCYDKNVLNKMVILTKYSVIGVFNIPRSYVNCNTTYSSCRYIRSEI